MTDVLLIDTQSQRSESLAAALREQGMDVRTSTELPALDSPLPGVRALWFDRSGGFFFGTHESSAVGYVDPEGILHAFLDDRELSEVRGLSQTGAGDLLIVDHDGGRVWRMKRER